MFFWPVVQKICLKNYCNTFVQEVVLLKNYILRPARYSDTDDEKRRQAYEKF